MNVIDQFSLKGKVAVVTGAGSGLGLAFSEAMAEAGASVVCADISGPGAEHAAKRVATLGASAIPVMCDVAEEEDVARLFADAVAKFGRVDIAIANAGIADPNPSLLHEYATKDWKRVMSVTTHVLQGNDFPIDLPVENQGLIGDFPGCQIRASQADRIRPTSAIPTVFYEHRFAPCLRFPWRRKNAPLATQCDQLE